MRARKKKVRVSAEPKPVGGICRTCCHAIFDETWGEYKCKSHEIRLYDISKVVKCEEYRKQAKEQ